jgi:hypothetical protein
MDKRGLTTDPNRNFGAATEWWESLGPTQKPSPYAYASWKYLQDYAVDIVEVPGEVTLVYDNGTSFPDYLYPIVWDGGLFNPVMAPTVVLDGGGFNSSGNIVEFEATTFATVYVYDSLASYPDVKGLNSIIINIGTVSTDPESSSQNIAAENNDTFFAEAPAQTVDDTPPGTMLGELSYTLTNRRVDLVAWSHNNWMDATPVRRAFQAMISSLPSCVDGVYVKDDPTAFWTDLGFKTVSKGDTELKFFPVRYRGY